MKKPVIPIKAPHLYARRVLLMVTGRTPQVVTETLYALSRRDPAFIPTAIHLITTAEGAQDANLALLDPEKGWFHKLVTDYGLREVRFAADHIHVIRDVAGEPISDIRSETDHQVCADLITAMVCDFTADETDTALHVSLAGGRKTMTYYLGNALTLFGRPQDRLSHVLVPPPYETNREFFYPTPKSSPLYIEPLERYFDARDAQVTLSDIPFVRLRDSLPRRFKGLAQGAASFTEVVAAMQQALEPPSVTVDYGQGALVTADGALVRLGAADLAFYGWLAERRQAGEEPPMIPLRDTLDWTPEERARNADCLADFETHARRTDLREGTGQDMKAEKAMTYQFFTQRKTSIRKALEKAIGPLADAYDIHDLTGGRRGGFGPRVAPERIRIVGEGPR